MIGIGKLAERVKERYFLLVVVLLIVFFYSMFFSEESVMQDATFNVLLGKQLTGGEYETSFFHRLPLIPFIFSLFFFLGADVTLPLFLVPLVFMILSAVSMFYFANDIEGRKFSYLATTIFISIPFFWRWGAHAMTDIPVMFFSMLFLICLNRSENDSRYFYLMGIVSGLGMLTKLSFGIIIVMGLLYLFHKNRKKIVQFSMSKDFILFLGLMILTFSAAFVAITVMKGGEDFSEFRSVASHVTGEEEPTISKILRLRPSTVNEIMKIFLFPLLIFFPLGVKRMWKTRPMYICFSVAIIFAFLIFWVLRDRYFSPIYPIFSLMIAYGFLELRKRFEWMAVMVFAILLVVSFAAGIYLYEMDSMTMYGTKTLSMNIKDLDGLILSDYQPKYLNLTKDVITDKDVLNMTFSYFSYSDLKGMGVDYVIISSYGEYWRSPTDETYNIGIFGFETPIKKVYTYERPPPNLNFTSSVYRYLENSGGFQRMKEVKAGQAVFIIYRLIS